MASRGAAPRGSTSSGKSSASSTRSGSGGVRAGSGDANKKTPDNHNHNPKPRSKPSDILNPKTVDPFNTSTKNQTAFAGVYRNGGVPCRLVHGSVKHKLAWDTPPELVPFDPVLITLAEGLRETVHPYMFVARVGFKELIESDTAGEKTRPLLPKLQHSLRLALAHEDPAVFEASLASLTYLSAAVGPELNQYLKGLLVPVAHRMMNKKFKDTITDALHQIESNGGHNVLPIVKSKIPTYSSIYT